MIDSWLSTFYVAGGTLRPDSPSYVHRPADVELLRWTRANEFCYVLTARQLGKSSLMIRTAIKLREEDVATVLIDLTKIGTNVEVEQWYLGLLLQITRQLHLATDPEIWWNTQANLSPVHRFTDFLHDVLLQEMRGPVVIFIDEIDTTLKLKFSDDFFAAIRSIYNDRAIDTIYNRLTFVLIGVATPTQLIKDRSRTPFNIGQAINLHDFRGPAEAETLNMGLSMIYPDYGTLIFNRILYWTDGHPYLTQKLCLYAAELNLVHWTESRVDEIVGRLFFSDEASRETNLQFVRDTISVAENRDRLLKLYTRIYHGEIVYDNEKSTIHNQLKLIGLVKTELGVLKIRNEIYRRVFDMEWANDNMPPITWSLRRVLVAMMIIFVFGLSMGYLFYQREQRATIKEQAQLLTDGFRSSSQAENKVRNLARLYELIGYEEQADTLFDELSQLEQVALFDTLPNSPALDAEIVRVVAELYADPENSHNEPLQHAMLTALQPLQSVEAIRLTTELQRILRGRIYKVDQNYAQAIDNYSKAIDINDKNPTTWFDRAEAYLAIQAYPETLHDLETVLILRDEWTRQVQQLIQSNPTLYKAWWAEREAFPELTAILITPTPTSTATPTATDTPTATPSPSVTPTGMPTATSTLPPTPAPTDTVAVKGATPPSPTPIPTETPVPTPQAATIIFVQSSGATHNIGLADWQGHTLNETLHHFAAAPIWSPDGTQLAFFGEGNISQLGGIYRAGSGIWQMNMVNNSLNQLIPEDHITNMNWSPDGTKIAYEVKPPFQQFAEVVVVDSGTGKQLNRFPGEQPTWQNNGQQLILKGCMPECGLWRFNVDGSAGERLTFDSTDSYPAWSADGEYLAFSSRARAGNWEIYLLRVADETIIRLTNRPGTDTTPVFSPDGLELYLRTDARTGTWEVTAINLFSQVERVIKAEIGASDDWGLARPAVR